MSTDTAALARSITWASSRQSYYTARYLVDEDLVDDCYRAYSYFRWLDDIVDAPTSNEVSPWSSEGRIFFVSRQRELIERLYRNERPLNLTPQEEIIADLISHDRRENGRLQSFILNFLAIIEFDARRRGRLISQGELAWYSSRLGKAVTDAIQYFIGNERPYPTGDNHYLAATAAHITHMLRDLVEDTEEGYINLPREYLAEHGIHPQDVGSPPFRAWVQERVQQARACFREGKRYIEGLAVLRCKIAAHWYCARFEGLLDTIERDGYVLRARYERNGDLSTWFAMAWLALSVTLRHITRRSFCGRRNALPQRKVKSKASAALEEAP
jgi:phytoene/squalene synthetase